MPEEYPSVVIGFSAPKPAPEPVAAPVAEAAVTTKVTRYDERDESPGKRRTGPMHATLIDIFNEVVSRPRLDLLRCKRGGTWSDISTGEFSASVRRLAAFMVDFGAQPGDRLALLSENRPEWAIADFAIQLAGAITVPLYTSLSPEQIAALIKDSEPRAILVSRYDQFRKVMTASRLLGQRLRILLFDPLPAGLSVANEPAEVAFLSEAYVHGGRCLVGRPDLLEQRTRSIGPDSVASIIYTSGTTGEPRGVMLTHANFCSNIDTSLRLLPISAGDVALSFLPLAHVFERMVEYLYLCGGGSIAYAESIDKVSANILEIRPTVLSSVPRVLEKVRAKILEAVRAEPWVRRRLFYWSLRAGRKRISRAEAGRSVHSGASPALRLADRLVHDRLRERLGGRIRFIVSGGAPLPREIADFFLSAGIVVLEGYGLTETSPVVSVNTLDHMRLGTVGRVIPGVEVKIDKEGEILVKGPNVMKGYFRNPEATREVMRDGYFATGDIGHLDKDGFLTITDRKKDIIITSGGKNIAPQPIENALKAARLIANAVLVGDGRKFIAALIVPDFTALKRMAGREKWGELSPKELIVHPGARQAIEAEIETATASFGESEKIRKFTLLARDFAAEEGEITPTMKVRRRVIFEHFASEIDAMYKT